MFLGESRLGLQTFVTRRRQLLLYSSEDGWYDTKPLTYQWLKAWLSADDLYAACVMLGWVETEDLDV